MIQDTLKTSRAKDPGEDPLADLQLRVARRADELATFRQDRTSLNLLCWLQAEEEVLGAWRAPAGNVEAGDGAAAHAHYGVRLAGTVAPAAS